MVEEVSKCSNCPYCQYDQLGGYHACTMTHVRSWVYKEIDEIARLNGPVPEWCPLRKEDITIKLIMNG